MPPSGEPVKELVLQDLEAVFLGITEGTDYYTTVRRVHRVETVPIEVKEYPCIILTPLGSDYDQPGAATTLSLQTHSRIRATLIVRTRDNATLALERFIRDVHKALLVDITRGGLAINSRMLDDRVYYPTQLDEPVAVADCTLEIYFRTLRTDLNSAT